MAEFVMKALVAEAGVEKQYEIASAATSREEMGNPVYPPVQQLLNEHGISCAGKRARQVTAADYDHYDYLIIMEEKNYLPLLRIVGDDEQHKIYRLLDFTNNPRNIADPWFTGGFNLTWQEVNEGCRALLAHLEEADHEK